MNWIPSGPSPGLKPDSAPGSLLPMHGDTPDAILVSPQPSRRFGVRLPHLIVGITSILGAVLVAPAIVAAATEDPTDAFFAREQVVPIAIEISPEGMATLRAYEFRKGSNPEERTNVAATVRAEGRAYTNVALHLKGSLGSYRDIEDQPAFTLNFDKWADGQSFHGLKKLSLNNSVQDGSFASERISRDLFRAAGLPCPRSGHARVTLNGRDLGLYVLLEGWNKQFLKRHFADSRGNLWDSGSAGDIDKDLDTNSGEDPSNRRPLDALIQAAQTTNLTARLDAIGRVLDLDRFITLMAMEVMLLHWDGYAMNRNNYRVFHDRSADRLIFLPHGMDQMFGQFRHRPDHTITPMMRGLVARSVMQVPEARRRYLERMEQLFQRHFNVEHLTNQVDAITARIEPTLTNYLSARLRHAVAAPALKDRILRRAASVRQQLATAATPVAFGPSGEVTLTNWTSSTESGSPSFRRQATPIRTLEINAPPGRTRSYGSWRTDVYLDAGTYRLIGRVRLVDAEFGSQVTLPGASLRLSGDREAPMIQGAAGEWQEVSSDFSVVGREDLTVVCEFRASKGTAIFDADSLKLIRKPAGSSAPR